MKNVQPAGESLFTVQKVVQLTGLSEHTLRYYERVGLISSVRRHKSSQHRQYSPEDIARLEALSCMRALGMRLADMKAYLAEICLPDSIESVLKPQQITCGRKFEGANGAGYSEASLPCESASLSVVGQQKVRLKFQGKANLLQLHRYRRFEELYRRSKGLG